MSARQSYLAVLHLAGVIFAAAGCDCQAQFNVGNAQAQLGDGSRSAAEKQPGTSFRPVAFSSRWQSPAYDKTFRAHWQDGRAEVSSYALRIKRYGQWRDGSAVAVFVTEAFRVDRYVKAERQPKAGVSVIKLNWIRNFQTGIYDYNLMTSAFALMRPHDSLPVGSVLKLSFSSQEWCGHVYQQALFKARAVEHRAHSYFETEADQTKTLPFMNDGFAEDALLLWAHALAGPQLQPGKKLQIPLYRSMAMVRLEHIPQVWDQALLQHHGDAARSIKVAGKAIKAVRLSARINSKARGALMLNKGRQWFFWVEKAFPHRVLRIEQQDKLEATLVQSTRMPYWQLNHQGDETQLKDLGLKSVPVPALKETP